MSLVDIINWNLLFSNRNERGNLEIIIILSTIISVVSLLMKFMFIHLFVLNRKYEFYILFKIYLLT